MRLLPNLMVLAIAAGCAAPSAPPPAPAAKAATPEGFTPTPEQHAMPKSLLVVKRTSVGKARFPVIDFHFHGRTLETAEDYQALVRLMDQAGVGAIANMDGGMFDVLDTNLRIGDPHKQRIVHFARPVWEGINDPGWSEKTAAELERAFEAGAQGLKINKALGLELKNADGTYILPDDPRMDPIWAMCAKHGKPVMIHVSDPIARWDPIGPDNERYEAGLWRTDTEGNYHNTGQPHYTEIWKHQEAMLRKHPKTRFVLAHIANMSEDLERAGKLLDTFPNADVELSARYHDLGGADALEARGATAGPLAHLRCLAARRGPAEAVLRECLEVPTLAARVDRHAVGRRERPAANHAIRSLIGRLGRYSVRPLAIRGTMNGARVSARANSAVASASPLQLYVSESKCSVRPVW